MGLRLHAERMERAYEFLDKGKFQEALDAFKIALESDDPLAPRALLGMAELFEILGDNETRLEMAIGAFEFDDRTLKLAAFWHHYLTLTWPTDEQVQEEPEQASRKRAELIAIGAGFLPGDSPDSDLDFEVATYISAWANRDYFSFDVGIAEAQLHASFILAVESADLKIQYAAMLNLHTFFMDMRPSEIIARLAMNNASPSWIHFDDVLAGLDDCEKSLQDLEKSKLNDDELTALAAEFDRLMDTPDYNFYDTYLAFAFLIDYLRSPFANRENPLVQSLWSKYLS